MKPYYLSILLIIICSCRKNSPPKDNSNKKNYQAGLRLKHITWEQELKEAEKDHEIYDIVELSKDTIILLRHSIGIELSTNGGKTWQWLGKKIFRLDELTVDNKGIWWGLERWKGIHEPSYCIMDRSFDRGKTWDRFIFHPLLFFPYHIYSKPHEQLAITNFGDNKVFSLSGSDPQHNWRCIKQLPEKDLLAEISIENYFVSRDNDNNKLYVKRKSGKVDTLMSFTNAYNIYYIEKTKNKIYVAGTTPDGINSYFGYIVNEHMLKNWIVPGGDVNMIKTQMGHIFLTCATGAYLFKNNQLIQIF